MIGPAENQVQGGGMGSYKHMAALMVALLIRRGLPSKRGGEALDG